MSAVNSSRPSLVSRISTSKDSMWIDVKTSSLTSSFRTDDGILEVVAIECVERDKDVLADGQLTFAGGRAISQDLSSLHLLAELTSRLVVLAGPFVEPLKPRNSYSSELSMMICAWRRRR